MTAVTKRYGPCRDRASSSLPLVVGRSSSTSPTPSVTQGFLDL